MIANKLLDVLSTLVGTILLPVQAVTTFVLGLAVSLTFGLLLLPISAVWIIIFYLPILGISRLYDALPYFRWLLAVVGFPFALLGDLYVALMPSMGEKGSRMEKLVFCEAFPVSWRYCQFRDGRLNPPPGDPLFLVLSSICSSKVHRAHLDRLKAEAYSRKEYSDVQGSLW